MSEDSLEKIMKDLFENYAIKCLVKDKNGNTKIPGYLYGFYIYKNYWIRDQKMRNLPHNEL